MNEIMQQLGLKVANPHEDGSFTLYNEKMGVYYRVRRVGGVTRAILAQVAPETILPAIRSRKGWYRQLRLEIARALAKTPDTHGPAIRLGVSDHL